MSDKNRIHFMHGYLLVDNKLDTQPISKFGECYVDHFGVNNTDDVVTKPGGKKMNTTKFAECGPKPGKEQLTHPSWSDARMQSMSYLYEIKRNYENCVCFCSNYWVMLFL